MMKHSTKDLYKKSSWDSLLNKHYVHHTSNGITLSQLQAEQAQHRIQQAGLTERCRVEVRDYRDMNEANSFDKIISVGMFEHVGEKLMTRGDWYA